MSKFTNVSKGEMSAVTEVRLKSLRTVRDSFEKGPLNKKGEFYDRRVYFDGQDEYYPYMFSKTLPHNVDTGFPLKADVDKLLVALEEGDESSLSEVPMYPGSLRKLEGIAASHSFNLMGTDASVPYIASKTYPVDSVQGVFEMAEVYAMSVLRDIPFSSFQDEGTIDPNILSDLNSFQSRTTAPVDSSTLDITPKTLFRGSTPGEISGPYISQFLLLPYMYGNLKIDQKYAVEADSKTSATEQGWRNIQNGLTVADSTKTNFDDARYVYNGRVLGSKVHNDPLYQFYYQAALIAMQNDIGPDTFVHPKTTAWTSGGGPDVLGAVAGVAVGALRMSWHQKWDVSMHIRPEVMAHRLKLAQSNASVRDKTPGLQSMVNLANDKMSNILNKVKASTPNESILLPLMFEEGSPTHPSFPAGHAAVAGACCTVLKAMLKTHERTSQGRYISRMWPQAVKIGSIDGMTLEDYTGSDTPTMTVAGELNKLASNVSIGRNWAGVHYRCDGDCGMELGEQFAITYLEDKCKEYHESISGLFEGFILEKFDGTLVHISADGIASITA